MFTVNTLLQTSYQAKLEILSMGFFFEQTKLLTNRPEVLLVLIFLAEIVGQLTSLRCLFDRFVNPLPEQRL